MQTTINKCLNMDTKTFS